MPEPEAVQPMTWTEADTELLRLALTDGQRTDIEIRYLRLDDLARQEKERADGAERRLALADKLAEAVERYGHCMLNGEARDAIEAALRAYRESAP